MFLRNLFFIIIPLLDLVKLLDEVLVLDVIPMGMHSISFIWLHEGCGDNVMNMAGLFDEGEFMVVVIFKSLEYSGFGCYNMVGLKVI